MFNESFYPTPADIATKMYRELEYKSRRTILEPSAGKGDILKALKYSIDKFKVYCIEQHPDLQAILRELIKLSPYPFIFKNQVSGAYLEILNLKEFAFYFILEVVRAVNRVVKFLFLIAAVWVKS